MNDSKKIGRTVFHLPRLRRLGMLGALCCSALSGVIYPQTGTGRTPIDQLNLAKPLENCWIHSVDLPSLIDFASDNADIIYLPVSGGKIASIDTNSGRRIWESNLGGEITAIPVIDTTTIYVVSEYSEILSRNEPADNTNKDNKKTNRTMVRRLDRMTGVTKWEQTISKTRTTSRTETAAGLTESQTAQAYVYLCRSCLVVAEVNGRVKALDALTGKIIQEIDLGSELTLVPFSDGTQLYLGTRNRFVVLEITDGQVRVSREQDIKPSNKITAVYADKSNRSVIRGDVKGFVTSYNSTLQRKNWVFRGGARVTALQRTDRGLLVTSQDNFLYMLAEKSGKLLWKKRLSGRIGSGHLINANSTVFTLINEPSAVILSLVDGRTINNIVLPGADFFSGGGEFVDKFLIFVTAKGVQAFSNSDLCRPIS